MIETNGVNPETQQQPESTTNWEALPSVNVDTWILSLKPSATSNEPTLETKVLEWEQAVQARRDEQAKTITPEEKAEMDQVTLESLRQQRMSLARDFVCVALLEFYEDSPAGAQAAKDFWETASVFEINAKLQPKQEELYQMLSLVFAGNVAAIEETMGKPILPLNIQERRAG